MNIREILRDYHIFKNKFFIVALVVCFSLIVYLFSRTNSAVLGINTVLRKPTPTQQITPTVEIPTDIPTRTPTLRIVRPIITSPVVRATPTPIPQTTAQSQSEPTQPPCTINYGNTTSTYYYTDPASCQRMQEAANAFAPASPITSAPLPTLIPTSQPVSDNTAICNQIRNDWINNQNVSDLSGPAIEAQQIRARDYENQYSNNCPGSLP